MTRGPSSSRSLQSSLIACAGSGLPQGLLLENNLFPLKVGLSHVRSYRVQTPLCSNEVWSKITLVKFKGKLREIKGNVMGI